jgi:hypothetical protein
MTNGLAAVLAQYSLGLGSKIEVLHDLPQGMLGELPDLKEVRLAEIPEFPSELRVHFDAQCSRCHTLSILFVTESGQDGGVNRFFSRVYFT